MKAFITIFLLAALGITSFAQDLKVPVLSPKQTVKQNFGISEITIEYSRPSVRSRVIFGELVPFGKIWRTGANASTQITFSDDVKIEGNNVPAGTYAIYTIPNSDSWEVLFYKDLKLAGNVNEYKPEEELLRVKLPVKSTIQKIETFTISINDISITSANVSLAWENASVSFNVSAEVDSRVMKNIDENMASEKPAYFQAASYYYDNGKDLSKALEWVNKAIEGNQKAYWMMMLKSRIQYKLGDYSGASASAEQVVTLAKEGNNEEYIKNGEKMLIDIKNTK
jgi:Protein of unknown function (DUF2911)